MPSMHDAPSVIPSTGRLRQEDQGFGSSFAANELEASLGHMTPSVTLLSMLPAPLPFGKTKALRPVAVAQATLADSCPALPLLGVPLPSPLCSPWGPSPLPSLPWQTRSCGRLPPLPLARHKATDAAVTDGASRPAPPPAATPRDAPVSCPIPSPPWSQGQLDPRAGDLFLRGPPGSGSRSPRPGAAEGLRSAGLSLGRGRDPVGRECPRPSHIPESPDRDPGVYVPLCGGDGSRQLRDWGG